MLVWYLYSSYYSGSEYTPNMHSKNVLTILSLLIGFTFPNGSTHVLAENTVPEAPTALTQKVKPLPLLPTPTYEAQQPLQQIEEQTPTQPSPTSDAKMFIYMHESGNNPDATNSQGCYGLGQDCNGIVRGRCGADYACQDGYFTSYCMSRYGSWENAVAYWKANSWW